MLEEIKQPSKSVAPETIVFEPEIREEQDIKQIGLNYPTEILEIKKRLLYLETNYMYAIDSWSSDDYSINITGVTEYYAWLKINFKANTANTWASTLNVNNMWAKTIVKAVSTALANNDILASMMCSVVYDWTNFVLLNPRTL